MPDTEISKTETTWVTTAVTALPTGYGVEFGDGDRIEVPAIAVQHDADDPSRTRVVAMLPMNGELLAVDEYIAVVDHGKPAPGTDVLFLSPGEAARREAEAEPESGPNPFYPRRRS